jgi:2-methylisocitrate lyase-like PEP mutase family enzyme
MYEKSGADWLLPVFVPSFEELSRTAREFPGRTASIVVRAYGGYTPSVVEAARAGVSLALVTGQYRNAFLDLERAYSGSITGHEASVFAARPDSRYLEGKLGLHRPGMDL